MAEGDMASEEYSNQQLSISYYEISKEFHKYHEI